MTKAKEQKPKEDRVKESVTLLKKLIEVGIATTDPGFKDTKIQLDKWINEGEAWSGKIEFPRYGRIADLVLPFRKDRVSSMMLKAPNK